MKLLIVGSGGREHALAWKCAQSADAVFVTSANDAMNSDTITAINLPTDEATVQWAKDNAVDLIVIGGEEPLARGLADACQQNDLLCLGPTQDGARLESSKIWMKKLCTRYHIPTAPWCVCHDEAAAHQCITQDSAMRVLKKDGLAAGKGVVVAHDEESALHHASHHFAHHDEPLLIEQRLDGRELSVFALLDGHNSLWLGAAQDYKRARDGDQGDNTGGMGAVSHDALVSDTLRAHIQKHFIDRLLHAMQEENIDYKGVLFAGLMVRDDEAHLLEYNVRFGDPECQTLMMRLQANLCQLLHAAASGSLSSVSSPQWRGASVNVVWAAQGYPHAPHKGGTLTGLENAAATDNVMLFHAATKIQNGKTIATGGRVLHVSACGDNLHDARSQCYDAVQKINFPKGFHRKDIGN